MLTIHEAILVDLLTLIFCVFLLLRHGPISFTHPATLYLFFHLYTVTLRLWAVANGAPTLFSGAGFWSVTEEEIVRAGLLFDMALVAMTFAWLVAATQEKRKAFTMKQFNPRTTLSLSHIKRVVVFTIPIGIVGLIVFANFPGIGNLQSLLGKWSISSWLSITELWFGLSIIALIYWYGFRRPLVVLMVLYLLIMAIQGDGRFRVIIPVILLVSIYLDRNGKRWPSLKLFLPFLLMGVLFFPLKDIGQVVQQQGSFDAVLTVSQANYNEVSNFSQGDMLFLDMTASSLTLTDRSEEFYFGKTYLWLFLLPIPRPLWPDKPKLGEHIFKISTVNRPMARSGMILTYLGEAYLNFSYFGIVLISMFLAYGLAKFYFHAYRSSYYSLSRFVYLLLAANLIQVYRDGLTSLVIFTFVNMMPLMIIAIFHAISPVRKDKIKYPIKSITAPFGGGLN